MTDEGDGADERPARDRPADGAAAEADEPGESSASGDDAGERATDAVEPTDDVIAIGEPAATDEGEPADRGRSADSGVASRAAEQPADGDADRGPTPDPDDAAGSADGAPTGEEPTGEEPTGEEPAGEEPTGEEPTGDDPTGDDPTGEDPTGQAPPDEMSPDETQDGETPDGETPPEGDPPAGAPVPGDEGDDAADATPADDGAEAGEPDHGPGVPADVRTYDRFTKIDGGIYDRANEFLRERTYVTAREWAIARLCADFRTETGVEMTKIGEHLPELVPFMTDTYSPQAVNQARASFEEKVRKSGATFLYGAMTDFFTAEELDDVMYEATEVAKFLLEVEGVDLSVEAELEAEEGVSEVMREVREHSAALRHDEVVCPECGHHVHPGED